MSTNNSTWQLRYYVTTPITWQGRRDGPGAPRYNEAVQVVDIRHFLTRPSKPAIALIGFACDAGITRNQGREGAAAGPQALRQALGNRAIHNLGKLEIFDFGDITCDDGNLEEAQYALATVVAMAVKQGMMPVVIGGGHEIAWGHYQGLSDETTIEKLGILNIDSHFDLRPLLEGDRGSSGTSFLQIARQRQLLGLPFDYVCIGIQPFGNTTGLFTTARELNTEVVLADDIHQAGNAAPAMGSIERLIERSDKVFVSLDMDVFGAAFAPGVSAPQPLGLAPWHVPSLLTCLAQSGKVIGFDIAELSPPHDHDNRTAGLAAAMLATFIANFI